MDAYIDLSYIFHVFILFTLPYYYKRIFNIKLSIFELISLIVFSLVLYFNAFIFKDYPYLNYAFVLGYFLLIYRKAGIKYYLLYLFVYYSNVSVSSIFSSSIYQYNGIVLLENYMDFLYVFLEMMNIIFIEIIFLSIKSIKRYHNYRINIEVLIKGKFIKLMGYLDSGNTLVVNDLPVIFLKDEYFQEIKYKEMIVNGIGQSLSKYFITKVHINDATKEVICASSKNGFKGCDCLININLMGE